MFVFTDEEGEGEDEDEETLGEGAAGRVVDDRCLRNAPRIIEREGPVYLMNGN